MYDEVAQPAHMVDELMYDEVAQPAHMVVAIGGHHLALVHT